MVVASVFRVSFKQLSCCWSKRDVYMMIACFLRMLHGLHILRVGRNSWGEVMNLKQRSPIACPSFCPLKCLSVRIPIRWHYVWWPGVCWLQHGLQCVWTICRMFCLRVYALAIEGCLWSYAKRRRLVRANCMGWLQRLLHVTLHCQGMTGLLKAFNCCRMNHYVFRGTIFCHVQTEIGQVSFRSWWNLQSWPISSGSFWAG